MSIKSLTAAMLIGVVTLTGCTSMSEYRERLKQYNDSQSYAMNVTRQFWQPKFSDTPVPKGVFVSNSTLGRDVTLSTMSWLAGGSSLLPGGFGLDLGMAFISEMGKKTPPDMLPHILAYVDASKFPTRKEAELEAVRQVHSAVKKALNDTGLSIAKDYPPTHTEILWTDFNIAEIQFENEKLGCTPWRQISSEMRYSERKTKACWVEISVRAIDEDDLPATTVPDWMATQGIAWPIAEKAEVRWIIPETANVDKDALFAAAAKYLPDDYWFYLEPRKKKGQKKYSAPYLLNNKGAHFFVIEKDTGENKSR